MNYINMQNIQDSELQIYHQLRDSAFREDGSFIADSPKVVNVLLGTKIEVKSILATKEYYDEFHEILKDKNIAKLFVASKSEMQKIVGHKIHHNCMMHGVRPALTPLENLGKNIIMLDEITSAENIGSIARSAAALGVDSYLLPSKGPNPYQRRALRVSMGHISKLKVHIYKDIFETIQFLKERGYKIFGAEVRDNSINLADIRVPQKWVLLMGHEQKGLSDAVLEVCDATLKIEMLDGVRSFNVGVAASIMMYKFKML